MFLPNELRILLVLAILFTIPGWFLLLITGAARSWTALQRWCLAIGLSTAFFPVLMYFLRLLPDFRMGVNKWLLLLVVMALAVVWSLRKTWRSLFNFDALEWLVIAVLLATLFTRLWMAYLHPYPAWTDSLHHTLITQLASEQGRLPNTLQPYAPTPLDMYHLGLYALSSTLMLLARVPAYTALLWTAQALNGLCGLGIFLVLDRKVGRIGALVGAAVVGLFSFQPAWYFNWGRFTQVASQAILLVAWLVTWETIHLWRVRSENNRVLWGMALLSAFLTAGVFLLHFRVASFYLPLLAVTLLIEFHQAWSSKARAHFFAALAVVGFLSITLIAPSLFMALQVYYTNSLLPSALPTEVKQASASLYYEFPISSVVTLGMQPWLLIAGLLSAAYNLFRQQSFSLLILVWVLLMVLEGFAYLLRIPLLNITNMGAVLILLYLPLGLIMGQAAEGLWYERLFSNPKVRQVALAGFLFAAFLFSHIRVGIIEPSRYFLDTGDIVAMEWIKANTPADSLFAINTFFWTPAAPHGSDGGYWIPYFAERKTTSETMLFSLVPDENMQRVINQSLAVKAFQESYTSLDALCEFGVNYIYLGAKGDFTGQGLDFDKLQSVSGATLVYHSRGASVFEICQQ